MKASEVQELQRKLARLQFQLNHQEDSDTEVAEQSQNETREDPSSYLKDDFQSKKFKIDDFDIYSTLGEYLFNLFIWNKN